MPEDSPPQNQEQVLTPEDRQRFENAYQYLEINSEFWTAQVEPFWGGTTSEQFAEGKRMLDDLWVGLKNYESRAKAIPLITVYLGSYYPWGYDSTNTLPQEFKKYCADKLMQAPETFVDLIGQHYRTLDEDISFAITDASRLSSDEEAIARLNESLSSKISILGEAFLEDPNTYSMYLNYFLEHPEHPENHLQAKQYILELLDRDASGGMGYLASLISGCPVAETRRTGEQLLAESLSKKYNIDGRVLIDAWKCSGYSYREEDDPEILHPTLDKNLLFISELEQERPEITEYLTKTCGIRHLARYPKEMLIEQFDTREQHDEKPYLVVLYPYDDHNGVFYQYESIQALEGMHAQAKKIGRNVRIIEAASSKEILGRFNMLHRKHGEIAGGVGAHGTWDSMQFGSEGEPRSVVSIADIMIPYDQSDPKYPQSNLIDKAGEKYFVKDPYFVLSSCSTGKGAYSMGQFLAMRGMHIVAPNDDTALESVTVREIEDKVMLGAKFTDAKAMAYSG